MHVYVAANVCVGRPIQCGFEFQAIRTHSYMHCLRPHVRVIGWRSEFDGAIIIDLPSRTLK